MHVEDEWDRISYSFTERLEEAVEADGQEALFVEYSAYKVVRNLPVDNLDEVAVSGPVRLIRERDEFYGGPSSESYESPVVDSPTWLQVAVLANRMIVETKDFHHCFLEGLEHILDNTYRFTMGS